jgi:hypothetical protein
MHDVSVYTGYNMPLVEVAGILFGTTCESGDILRIYPDAKRTNDKGEVWVYADILHSKHAGVGGWVHLTTLEYIERDGTAEVPTVPKEEVKIYVVKSLIQLLPSQAERLRELGFVLEDIA